MAQKRRSIAVMTGAIVVALLGLIGVQVLLLQSAMEQKDQAFRQNAVAVLQSVARRLEAGEAALTVFRTATGAPRPRRIIAGNAAVLTDTLPPWGVQTLRPPLRTEGNTVVYSVGTPQRVTLRVYAPDSDIDTVVVDTFKQPGEYVARVDSARLGSEYMYTYTADSLSFMLQVNTGGARGVYSSRLGSPAKKEELVSRVLDRMVIAERLPLERRIIPAQLDSFLTAGFTQAGIGLAYAFGIVSPGTDSLRLVQPTGYTAELKESGLRTRLFPADVFSPPHELVVYFPDQRQFVLQQMGPLLAASVLFMGIIVAGFAYSMKTIAGQRRVARLMTDFINNMTHEFKTPISTIALASEAIQRPDVLDRREKVLRYNGIIHEENTRMRGQVEKILQMAVLEKGEYELNIEPVDVHAVAGRAAEHIALDVENRGGRVECEWQATEHTIDADPVHFTNIVNNLLDNANKYSPSAPRIVVGTRNTGAEIALRVEDNGIGIAPEHLKKVFDRYYRVSTGNVHDVKGFGLGLSYVRLMTTAMGGRVEIESSSGKGTAVTVFFPVTKGSAE